MHSDSIGKLFRLANRIKARALLLCFVMLIMSLYTSYSVNLSNRSSSKTVSNVTLCFAVCGQFKAIVVDRRTALCVLEHGKRHRQAEHGQEIGQTDGADANRKK